VVKSEWPTHRIACFKARRQPEEACFKLLSADQQASVKVKLDSNPPDLQPGSAVPTPDQHPGSGNDNQTSAIAVVATMHLARAFRCGSIVFGIA
jgi:hypothetical protein